MMISCTGDLDSVPIQELKPSLNLNVRQINLLLQTIFLSLCSRPLVFTIYSCNLFFDLLQC